MIFEVYVYFLVFLVGICIGSFLNVCIHRMPAGQSVVSPPSHCPSCGYTLRWFDNIPVLSYLFLKGKCRSCSKPISIQYPLIELGTGAALVWICIYLNALKSVLL